MESDSYKAICKDPVKNLSQKKILFNLEIIYELNWVNEL
jgi:hypothetical protein